MSRLHDQGEQNVGDIWLRNSTQNTQMHLGLYTNGTQPAEDALMTGITEVSGGGYARIPLPPADWTRQGSQTGEGGTRYDQPERTFTFNAAVGNVTGYFITPPLSGTAGPLIVTEHFPAAVNVNQANFTIRITPRIEFR